LKKRGKGQLFWDWVFRLGLLDWVISTDWVKTDWVIADWVISESKTALVGNVPSQLQLGYAQERKRLSLVLDD